MLLKIGVENSIFIAPVMEIGFKKILPMDYETIKTFIVSSSNSIEAIKKNIKFLSHLRRERIPILCVGKQAEQMGKLLGLNIFSIGLTVSELIVNLRKKIIRYDPKVTCYLRGNIVTIDLVKCLGIKEKIVYCQKKNEIKTQIKKKIKEGEIGSIFFFSKNTVHLFFDKIDDIGTDTDIYCFSKNIRNLVNEKFKQKRNNVFFAKKPTTSDMIDLFLSKN